MNTKNLGLAFMLALGSAAAGCADDPKAGPGGGGGGGGSGSGSGGEDVTAMDASGKYGFQSTYDVSTNMPGTAGHVVNYIIDATDSPDDPTKWLMDQIIAKMPSGTMKNIVQGAEPFVVGYLNDRLLDWAPDFVTTFVQLGNDFGQMTKNFGVNEQFELTGSGTSYMAVDTAVGVHFKIDNVATDLAFTDFNMQNVVVQGVGVTLDTTGKMSIAQHKLPLSYGKLLHIGLDKVAIPNLDPSATDLGSLLADLIDCQSVGQNIYNALVDNFGYGGSVSLWQSACSAGLQFGASAIYSKIDGIDSSALEFDVAGEAKAADTNGDHKIDAISLGKWSGNLSYGGTPAPLTTATFSAKRM